MTKDEALRLALEALENSDDLVRENAYSAEQLYGNYPARQGKVRGLKALVEDHEKAITAIKAALEAKDEPVAWAFFFEDGEASNELFDTREQGEKWLLSDDCLWAGSLKPLYTTPPQRKPLTDEEIGDIAALYYPRWQGHEGFARAIERAHGIKETEV